MFVAKLLCIATFLSAVNAVIVRDYNFVNYVELDSFEHFKNTYMNLEKDTMNQNLMLGVATPECWSKLESPAFRGIQRHSGGGPMAVVALPAAEYPYPASLVDGNKQPIECANVIFYRRGDRISAPTATTSEMEHRYLNVWLAERMRVKGLVLTNGFPYPVNLYWQEESHDPVFQGVMAPGSSQQLSSFIGHIFSVSSVDPLPLHEADPANEELADGFRNLVDFMVVDGDSYTFSPVNRLETCEIEPGATRSEFVDPDQPLDCENMYHRLLAFAHSVYYAKRLGLNYVQPQFVEQVTPTGFEHRTLPPATYAWLKGWYDRERLLQEEIESSSGPCMNQHVAPSGVTHLTAEHKDRLSNELRDILEGWHGAPLQLTSIYGIRKYTNGSVLRMHVDTVNTHVVSAIINVDQDVDEDWPLLILDHQDNEHNIIMKPGDMVLYESAKLLHGRPEMFKGRHYDNIFIHYKPVSGWNYDWL